MRVNRLISLVSIVLQWTAGAVTSSTQPVTQRTAVARMVLRVLTTPDDGPSVEQASSDVELGVGQSGSTVFATSTNLCARAIGGGSSADRIASPRHVWTVRFTLASAQTDRIAVDVDVERQDDAPSGTRHTLRHLVLTEGAPHVLDFVESAGQSCQTANIVIEVTAAMIEASDFERQLLNYDLWLTHRDAGGREWTRHETRTAPQGGRVDFRFKPLGWSTRSLMPSLNIDQPIDEHVFGSIRARVRADRQLELSLVTSRNLVQGQGAVGRENGMKVFTAEAGEVISIELPSPRGRSVATAANGSRTLLDYQELFKGHTTALVLVVNRIPQNAKR